jgi:hypothetical protein
MRAVRLIPLLVAAAACGGANNNVVDGSLVDADPTPDALPINRGCFDAGTIAGSIMIRGRVVQGIGRNPSPGTTVQLFMTNESTSLAPATITDDGGLYSISVPTSNAPVNGVGKFNKGTNLIEWFYPSEPLDRTFDTADGWILSASDVSLVGLVIGESFMSADHAIVGVLVVDCAFQPIQGAKVVITPTPRKLAYVDAGNTPRTEPDMTSTGPNGIALGWNVPVMGVGAGTVSGTYDNRPLKAHTLRVHNGEISLTILHP